MAEINFKTFLNRRILIESYKKPIEVKVLEISPTGEYIKVQNLNGHKEWLETKGVEVLEVLEEVIEGKPVKDLEEWMRKEKSNPLPWREPYISPPYKTGYPPLEARPDFRTRVTYTDKTI